MTSKYEQLIVVLPFRLASERLPQKVLLPLSDGRALCVHAVERALKALQLLRESPSHGQTQIHLLAAVDAAETEQALRAQFSDQQLKIVMTPVELPSGTDRVAAACRIVEQQGLSMQDDTVIVNIQGDMPQMSSKLVAQFLEWCVEKKPVMGTLAHDWPEDVPLQEASHVKVLLNSRSEAIYFSRFALPYSRVQPQAQEPILPLYHVGIYVYSKAGLEQFCALPRSPLEIFEGLEQLRALHNAIPIQVHHFQNNDPTSTFASIDTPSDWNRLL